MSLNEKSHDLGFAGEQITEGVLFSKGVGLAVKNLGIFTKVGNVAMKGVQFTSPL